jgi:two-component system sensor kinase FixL
MFGYGQDEIIGHNIRMLMPAQQAAHHDSYLKHYLKTGERRIIGIGRIVVARRKDGSTFPMELQIGEVSSPGTRLFTGFVRDLTEPQERDRRLAELQAELIHVSRLNELGQMVSALAHEVNQPLTAMANYLHGIKRLLTDETPAALKNAIDKVSEQSERARHIVQSLRSMVRKETVERRTENLELIIHEMTALALIGATGTIHLAIDVPADATAVLIDKVQIQQVLLNLMRNAVEAMRDSTRRVLKISALRRNDRIEIHITDTGCGLADSVRSRLFQPFVTTKAEGLGVGLSICRTILESHGGELHFHSETGGGTTFSFSVPAAPGT